jgi:hypothetical protein
MVRVSEVLAVLIVALVLAASSATADQVRYFQQNGVTYCETTRTMQRPVCETTMQQTTRTVYKQQYYTETKDVTQTTWCPVTTYQPETYWVGRWNPFVEPYVQTRWVPQTTWQQRTEVVKVPVTCSKLVPETQQVQVPVASQKMVSEEVVVSRVAVSTPAPCVAQPFVSQPAASPAYVVSPAQTYPANPAYINCGEQVGGVARLNQDPPRYGAGSNAGNSPAR